MREQVRWRTTTWEGSVRNRATGILSGLKRASTSQKNTSRE